MAPLAGLADWEVTCMLAEAMGYPMRYEQPGQIMDEIAALTPTFAGVSYGKLDELGSIQWPCNDAAPEGTPMMHVDRFVRGLGRFMLTEFVPTEERTGARFPLILTTGRILSQYNVGAQTRRTENSRWHEEDVLDIHPFDAEQRGISDGDLVALESRSGDIALRARVTDRMQPGVVYTTFHHARTGANVITTDHSDWATNCPEYKVTAVQVRRTNRPSEWQARFFEEDVGLTRVAPEAGGRGVSALDPGAKLDAMANQIATFFRPYPREEAVAGVHDHVVAFWSPSMRRDLNARIASGDARLDPVVVDAMGRGSGAESPTHREAAGPGEAGQVGASDAG